MHIMMFRVQLHSVNGSQTFSLFLQSAVSEWCQSTCSISCYQRHDAAPPPNTAAAAGFSFDTGPHYVLSQSITATIASVPLCDTKYTWACHKSANDKPTVAFVFFPCLYGICYLCDMVASKFFRISRGRTDISPKKILYCIVTGT